ncbi:hypothetical protein PsorP6_007395 [Peronosclerospora sorghi]|uniref:Uncharacterized protein n=1 Tax=Peronosclerospora sorghi TaxID=230839 RepID=A0ACC0W6T1_9STRA|nr:hypothetical protein PsorP6_007395 [Peronosclerospora sorghi]
MLGTGATIPEALAPRIKAIVTFGNPLKMMGQTIERSSSIYGSKAIEFCNMGDPVCGAGFNVAAHVTYVTDGSVMKAAQQADALVQDGAANQQDARFVRDGGAVQQGFSSLQDGVEQVGSLRG